MLKRMPFLNGVENRETFFRRISELFPTLDPRYKLIEKAYNDAKDAFRGKLRDDGETRYFEHIRAVVLIIIDYLRIRDYRIIIAAILHDIVEDIPSWTIERVRAEYGNEIALLVEYMTKPSKKDYPSKKDRDKVYHSRFDFAPREFFLLKLSDRLHNLLTLWNCTPEKRKRKIEETLKYYLPFAEKHLILYHEILEAIELLENPAPTIPLKIVS
jgi:GTP pyrophosphokinase